MKEYDATEAAYKNGYDKGKTDAFAEIVRCGECFYWRRRIGYTNNPNGNCIYNGLESIESDYCSFGERRKNDE